MQSAMVWSGFLPKTYQPLLYFSCVNIQIYILLRQNYQSCLKHMPFRDEWGKFIFGWNWVCEISFVQHKNKRKTMTEVQVSPFIYFKNTVEDRERSFETSAVLGPW